MVIQIPSSLEIFEPLAGKPYPGQHGGQWAYRDRRECPPIDAHEFALWPGKPSRWWRFTMWVKEWGNRAVRRHEMAEALKATRTLWSRHPWMRAGEVWWRPQGLSTYETIEPINGLHRWNIDRDDATWEFPEGYYEECRAASADGRPMPTRSAAGLHSGYIRDLSELAR